MVENIAKREELIGLLMLVNMVALMVIATL